MQHAVDHRREGDRRDDEHREAAVDRIQACEELAAGGRGKMQRPHSGEDHRRVEEGVEPAQALEEDCAHFHRANRDALAPFPGLHARFKKACDDYFFLKHRGEPRGIGGTFFDDFSEGGFDASFAVMRALGDGFLPAYVPIVERRRGHAFGDRERDFQAYRRGRYVEFNLVWDRGTHFGLQSGGRTESILLSMPPLASWSYGAQPQAGSREAELATKYLVRRDWV